MRIYISADIEGVAGVVSLHQLIPGEFEYERARDWMTAEVDAACQAAFSSGVEEVVVSDSHGNGENIKLERLTGNVRLVRSWPRPLLMMQGIDRGSFDAAAFIGYHAGGHSGNGVLSHTMSSGKLRSIRFNGEFVSEFDMNRLLAAEFYVPVIMGSGDNVLAEDVTRRYPGVEFATTKWTEGSIWAETLTLEASCALISEKMTKAIANLKHAALPTPIGPVTIEIDFARKIIAEVFCYMPDIRRSGPFTVEAEFPDMVATMRFLAFVLFGLNPFAS
ncbi:MAG: M55 family metallopeptidase [Proteobacteria bacterium]|nr:M55 family metallopeptidase [Pseudomonadota bacterium]